MPVFQDYQDFSPYSTPLLQGASSQPPNKRSLCQSFHLDPPLLLGLLLLSLIGLIVLYSASNQDMALIIRQCTRLGLGFLVMVIVAQIPPHYFRVIAPWLFFGGLVFLVLVLLIGKTGKGAQRWLDIGIIQFQPSEMMKIIVPMMMAWLLSEMPLPVRTRRLLPATLALTIPVILIMKQPDLGTSLLIASSGLFVLLFAGISWKLVGSLTALCALSTPFLWQMMHSYQKTRILTLLNPERDPLGAGYHIIQSKIAIGSGGMYGKGWLNGTQTHLEFLPEQTTDFIFSVFAEEFGFMGILLLLTLYTLIILRGLRISTLAQGTFNRLLAGSLILTFFVYLFVNVGMVSGILPVVGLPLPLISYGGTSIVTIMAGFGMLMSIHTHRKLWAS
jgi:rod shape determining protein RodA